MEAIELDLLEAGLEVGLQQVVYFLDLGVVDHIFEVLRRHLVLSFVLVL